MSTQTSFCCSGPWKNDGRNIDIHRIVSPNNIPVVVGPDLNFPFVFNIKKPINISYGYFTLLLHSQRHIECKKLKMCPTSWSLLTWIPDMDNKRMACRARNLIGDIVLGDSAKDSWQPSPTNVYNKRYMQSVLFHFQCHSQLRHHDKEFNMSGLSEFMNV